jgi:hypothetical protein
MKRYLLITCILTIAVCAFSQSKSEVKDHGIKSTTVYDYDYSTGKEVKKIESITKFNEEGLVTEFSDYDKAGKLKEKITYFYNANNDVVEEKYYDSNNKLSKSYKFTYKGNLKLTKEKYSSSGKLESKKVYSYEM